MAIFSSINDETQCVYLLCLSSRFITYIPSFILGTLSLEKSSIKPRFVIELITNPSTD